jgi:ribosomal protein S8
MRSRFSARALVMKTSEKSEEPVICRRGRTSTPGWRMWSRTHEMPLCFAALPSVRARRIPQSAMGPLDVQIFWPLTRK